MKPYTKRNGILIESNREGLKEKNSSNMSSLPKPNMSDDEKAMSWDPAEYKLTYILDNFQLPQMVRVVEGFMLNEDDSLSSGTVLTIHSQKATRKVKGCDYQGRNINLPLGCPFRVRVKVVNEGKIYRTIKDLCNARPQPKCVELSKKMQHSGVNLKPGDRLLVENIDFNKHGEARGIVATTVDTICKRIALPMNVVGDFSPCPLPNDKNKRYLIRQLLEERSFPLWIEFSEKDDVTGTYGPHLGTIMLKELYTSDIVLATSSVDGARFAVTFPRHLPVTIQVAKGMLDNTAAYIQICKKFHDEIDVEVIQNMLDANPHAGECLNEIYSKFAPRRPPSRKSKQKPPQDSTGWAPYSAAKDMRPKTSSSSVESDDSGILQKAATLKVQKHRDYATSWVHEQTGRTTLPSPRRTMSSPPDSMSIKRPNAKHLDSDDSEGEHFEEIADYMDSSRILTVEVTKHSREDSCGSDSGVSMILPPKTDRNANMWQPSTLPHNALTKGAPSIPPRSRSSTMPRCPTKTVSLPSMHERDSSPGRLKIGYDSLSDRVDNSFRFQDSCSSTGGELESICSITEEHLEEIRGEDEEGICKLLDKLNLSNYKQEFETNQINGELLVDLEESDFVRDLGLSKFQARKLVRYIHGWRPDELKKDIAIHDNSSTTSTEPSDWSCDDVVEHMTTLKLFSFADFCRANQINGELLRDILDKDILEAIREVHGVKMSVLEEKKLGNFVFKGWRPDRVNKK